MCEINKFQKYSAIFLLYHLPFFKNLVIIILIIDFKSNLYSRFKN